MDSTTVACSFTECTEETYLPQTCPHCNKKFCDKHESQESHKCPFINVSKLRTAVCPMCGEVLRVEAGESLDHAVNTHLDSGKCSTNSKNNNNGTMKQSNASSFLFGFGNSSTSNNNNSTSSNSNFCSSCNQYEPVPVNCDHCKKNFCLKHKLPESHNCSKLNEVRINNTNNIINNNNNNNGGKILQGSVVSQQQQQQQQKPREMNDVLFQCTNTAETAYGVRPGRNITPGDILVLVTYDGSRLKRPNLRPVLFSVSPLTPIGRLLDAAIDHYPAIPKTLKFTIFSSVALTVSANNGNGDKTQKRHRVLNEGVNTGDAFAEAAAVGGVFPQGAMENFYSPVDNRVILAFCISTLQDEAAGGDLTTPSMPMMMTRSETEKAFAGAAASSSSSSTTNQNQNKPSSDFKDSPLETKACVVRPFKDAKGVQLPILVDREHLPNNNNNNTNLGSKTGNNGTSSSSAKKEDKCLLQ